MIRAHWTQYDLNNKVIVLNDADYVLYLIKNTIGSNSTDEEFDPTGFYNFCFESFTFRI